MAEPLLAARGRERLTGEAHAAKKEPWKGVFAATSWSPDGKNLFFVGVSPTSGADIWVLQEDGEGSPQPLLRGSVGEWWAELSPKGRWLAYISDESGRPEIYVTAFPGSGGRWPISTDGGMYPVWARNGRELYYLNGRRMMVVTITSDTTFAATKPRVLFETKKPVGFYPSYDVTPDGEFLMIEPAEPEAPPTQINVVLNWIQEVRQRVAADEKR